MNKLLKKIACCGLVMLTLSIAPMHAQSTQMVDKYQAGSQYLAYPRPAYGIPELTPAPEGYEPFHIEHYGRHGSRWLLNDKDYALPVKYLEKADKKGLLTPRGKELLVQLKQIHSDSKGRLGELTPLGHRQHRDIARRMTQNFPEIFKPGTYIDAKSTVVIRCILSMANEIAEIERLVPGVITKYDASRTTQKTLAPNSTDAVARKLQKDNYCHADKFAENHADHTAFMSKIFTNPKFLKKKDEDKFFSAVFDIAVNAQSHDDQPDLYDLFTPEELHNEWLNNNAWWYIYAGNTSITNNRVPFMQTAMLRNIIESADTAMTSKNISANLRFGHESIVLPLTVLLEANGKAYDTANLDDLEANWRNYEVFPMGSNLQMIFYRPTGKSTHSADDVLVKLMLNEAEVTLPGTPVSGPYYKWTDLRKHYLDKLASVK